MEVKARRHLHIHRVVLVLAVILLALYVVLVNLLVSAALVPSFMRKLDAFETVTEQSYAQQMHTSDIQEHRRAALEATNAWLETANYKKLELLSADGYRLVAMEFPNDAQTHRWAVILHGYTGWKEEMYPFAYWYHREGYHVLVPDLRCNGESEGDFIGMGWTDRTDVRLWIDQILAQDPSAEIVLHGQSMGAACALMISGMEDLPDNLYAVISDCAYTDAYSMFQQDIREWFHLPAFPLVDSANLALQLRGGYDVKKASALEAVKKSRVPTLIIHGDQDAMIPVEMAYSLYTSEAAKKELLIIEGAGHAQAQDKDPALYYTTISNFLSTYIP